MKSKRFLKDSVVAPRFDRICRKYHDIAQVDVLRAYMEVVWRSLSEYLQDPLHMMETVDSSVVTFMGSVRFTINHSTGKIKVARLACAYGEIVFEIQERVCIDLPIRLSGFWLGSFLMPFHTLFSQCAKEETSVELRHELKESIAKELCWALRQSVHWRSLRHALRDALALDRQLLRWFRLGRHSQYRFAVLDTQYNWALSQRHHYEQLANENPNLMWLFNFLKGQSITLPSGDIVAAMKEWVLSNRDLTPAGWRFLHHCKQKHLRHVIEYCGPKGETDSRWRELVHWLSLMQMLSRKEPLHPAMTRLFFHDGFEAMPTLGLVKFRSILLKPSTLHSILNEAQWRYVNGSLESFIAKDVQVVLNWLQAVRPMLDANQSRKGWPYLAKQALQWKSNAELCDDLSRYRWASFLSVLNIGTLTVIPINDAWTLRKEAFAMRHCADQYIQDCIEGDFQMFSVRNSANKRVATLGLEKLSEEWISIGIRGFANAAPNKTFLQLEKDILQRHNAMLKIDNEMNNDKR